MAADIHSQINAFDYRRNATAVQKSARTDFPVLRRFFCLALWLFADGQSDLAGEEKR